MQTPHPPKPKPHRPPLPDGIIETNAIDPTNPSDAWNHEPEIVLAGIDHAAGKIAEPELKAAVETIFETKVSTAQFKNEYGASTAGPDALWKVRFAAGKALGIDLTA